MYGSISELEINWNLLNQIYFILNSVHDKYNEFNFANFLIEKSYGAKNAAMVINESSVENPYLELNNLWN